MHTNRKGMRFGELLSHRISKRAYSDCADSARQLRDFHRKTAASLKIAKAGGYFDCKSEDYRACLSMEKPLPFTSLTLVITIKQLGSMLCAIFSSLYSSLLEITLKII